MFPNLKNTKIESKKDYLSAGAYGVVIKSFKDSASNVEYKGTPYYEFLVEDKDGGIAYLKFSGVDSHTSEAAARVRTEIFKQFLINAGVKTFDNPKSSCEEAVGKSLYVCLAEREWWTIDKDTDNPVIKTRVEYKFSGTRPLVFKESYNKPLHPEQRADYERALNARQDDTTEETNLPF